MYVDNAVKQLNSANEFLQQQAAEDYNRKMANLQALNLAIATGKDDQRKLWQKRMDRSGLIGIMGDIKDALTPEDKTKLSAKSTMGEGIFNPSSVGNPQVNLEKGVIGNTAAMSQEQRNILLNKQLNDKQQAFMLADKEYRKTHGGQPLSIQEFNKMYENQLVGGQVSDNKNKDGYIVTEPEIQDNAQKRVEFLKQIQAEKDLQKGQQNLVNEQLAIDKRNKDAMALNSKAQMSNDNSFEGYMKRKGTAVKEFEGDWRDMSAQNLAMFRDAYNYYIDKDPNKAKALLGEYKLNQQGINKLWKEDPNAGLALDAFKAPKGQGKKLIKNISIKLKGNSTTIPLGEMVIPESAMTSNFELMKHLKKMGYKDLEQAYAHKTNEESTVNALQQTEANKNLLAGEAASKGDVAYKDYGGILMKRETVDGGKGPVTFSSLALDKVLNKPNSSGKVEPKQNISPEERAKLEGAINNADADIKDISSKIESGEITATEIKKRMDSIKTGNAKVDKAIANEYKKQIDRAKKAEKTQWFFPRDPEGEKAQKDRNEKLKRDSEKTKAALAEKLDYLNDGTKIISQR